MVDSRHRKRPCSTAGNTYSPGESHEVDQGWPGAGAGPCWAHTARRTCTRSRPMARSASSTRRAWSAGPAWPWRRRACSVALPARQPASCSRGWETDEGGALGPHPGHGGGSAQCSRRLAVRAPARNGPRDLLAVRPGNRVRVRLVSGCLQGGPGCGSLSVLMRLSVPRCDCFRCCVSLTRWCATYASALLCRCHLGQAGLVVPACRGLSGAGGVW